MTVNDDFLKKCTKKPCPVWEKAGPFFENDLYPGEHVFYTICVKCRRGVKVTNYDDEIIVYVGQKRLQ